MFKDSFQADGRGQPFNTRFCTLVGNLALYMPVGDMWFDTSPFVLSSRSQCPDEEWTETQNLNRQGLH